MVEKTEEKERVVTINLRKRLKAARWKRAKEASKVLNEILRRQTKAESIKIDRRLNERIWAKGGEKPATKLRVKIIKIDDKSVRAELME